MKIYTVKFLGFKAFSTARKAIEYVKTSYPEAHFNTYDDEHNVTKTSINAFTTEKLIAQLNKEYYIMLSLGHLEDIEIEKMHVN